MKKLSILLFSILISFSSYGEWTKFGSLPSGDLFYIDVDRIKEHNGYIYWWDLRSTLEPDKYGNMSVSSYNQGDCGISRWKSLTYIFHKLPMGRGELEYQESVKKGWKYAPPGSFVEHSLDYVCNYVK